METIWNNNFDACNFLPCLYILNRYFIPVENITNLNKFEAFITKGAHVQQEILIADELVLN